MPFSYASSGKRVLDVTIAAAVLAITAPLQLATALAVRRTLGRPVLFRQVRPGQGGRPFTLIKFRTMTEPDTGPALLTDADRLTPLGKVLRSTSLDELPTLWNVVKGDMSLVGPRPLLIQYLDRYTAQQARRHEVRPGITGLAQVRGRNSVDWEDRFDLDIRYVDNLSFMGDARILLQTISAVILQRGVSAPGHVTMPEFGVSAHDAAAADQRKA